MPLNPAFSVGQSAATPADVTFTNDATGTDVLVTQLRIYVTDSNGDPVVPSGVLTDYIPWPLATNPITVLNLLTQDIAATVTIQWLDVSDVVRYELSEVFCFRQFNIQNFIYLIQNQALKPNIVQDNNYFNNLCQYWINIEGANTMIAEAEDLAGSQNCLDRATFMLNNQSKFF
jgi:hypothetical protein